ncbi:MAG: family 10 glycosylhydrolase, partial [Amoebophilaceae bacterium]|nr:family 10 glycosylhydrolase [Amoebophilaceae bacterium]
MFEDKRHLRATWVASVSNLDWPSKASLTIQDSSERMQAQQRELIAILDEAVNMRMNAVFLHIKPCADALYNSNILPPSAYLTGILGQDPGYDPLAFAIEQAHQRNLELHAWFNPYRVSTDKSQETIDGFHNMPATAPPSVYTTQPGWIKVAYDRFLIDPGIPAARRWVVDGIMEVVKNYDIDGVHLDDYFYYESTDSPMDDAETFNKYKASFTDKGDWRRNNTLLLITELSAQIRAEKPYIKF